MRIVVFEVEEWERDAFETLEENHDIDFTTEALTAETAEKHADAEIISTFIYSELDADVLKQFRNLHLIATRSTGFDHIDLDYCEQNGVTICNVPTYGENTVAEHVFGLLLTISHNIFEALERTAKGDFSMKGLRGFDLRGKTLGVIGTGHIGQCVIEIARGFGMEVLAYDVKPREELASELNFRYADLKKVLSEADVITLHVPASKATHHLLSDDEFEHMKQDVVLINTARGSVIDVQALVRALADGKVRAAGLDVLPEEPVIREEAELLRSVFREEHDLRALLADHVLLRLRNVYITPHSAFNTREAVQRILDTTVENIRGFVRDEAQNVVHGK
jgi:D-lactate dehydrogenase